MPPANTIFPEYLKHGGDGSGPGLAGRFGIIPAEGRFNDESHNHPCEKRQEVEYRRHERDSLLAHSKPGGGSRNIFGGLKELEGYLMKRVPFGAGFSWRQLYFRLSSDHGGALEYDRQPLVFEGKIQWPPIESIRLSRFEDVKEVSVRPHSFCINLVDPVEELYLQASSEDEMLRWMNAVRGATEALRIQQTSVVMRLRWCREQGGDAVAMEGLGLRIIPPQVFEFVTVKEADFSMNELRYLTPEIHYLHNLRRLDLSKNQLIKLCHEIGQLINLIQLNLSYNHLARRHICHICAHPVHLPQRF